MSRPGLLFYCQHSLGLGHLARSLALADGLAAHFDVVLLNGGRLPTTVKIPPDVRVVNLPPLGHDADYELVSHDPSMEVHDACVRRRELVLSALAQTSPSVVLIEMYPFGRKKFEFELLPLLDAVQAIGADRPKVLCSLRDILVSERRDQARHDERASQRVNRYFDAVVMHSDPSFATLDGSFRPVTPIRVPVHYTGFVAPPTPAGSTRQRAATRVDRLLVSAGGGMVGEPLFRAAVDVHARLAERTGLTTTVVAGPFLPEPVWRWLQAKAADSPTLDTVRQVDDLSEQMRCSVITLSQCGYNTTMDILRAGTPALVVPFSEGKEDEQRRRAERLAAMGALRVTSDLDADRLLDDLCELARFQPAPVSLDLSGRATTARIIAEIAGAHDIRTTPLAAPLNGAFA
ncbi:MAG: glycosyltransferase family 28 [Propionibacteriales bacterium]|nr:glycosyltransferase family 28 [Propionibacteriales bacterium]